jgi:hypothetical protein
MFCAFQGKPNILRLYGRGRLVFAGSDEWAELSGQFDAFTGARQIIVCDVERIQNSCGLAVPLMQFESHRDGLMKWAVAKGEKGMKEYRDRKNRRSIDGIPIPSGD